MKIMFNSCKIAVNNIFLNKLRSFLTILGVVIGVITITSLLSIAVGVRKEITSQVEGFGSNLITVVSGQIKPGRSVNPTASMGASTLTETDYQTISKEVPEIRNLSMIMLLSGSVKSGKNISSSSLIFGTSEQVLPILNTNISSGRFINKEDLQTNSKVVVIGDKTAQTLFPNQDPINKTLEIREQQFKVIGVLKAKENADILFSIDFNDGVGMPITTAWEITNSRQILRIVLQAKNSDSVKVTQEKIRGLLLKTHKGEEDFSVLTQEDLLNIIGNILNILTAMLTAVAAISLVVGGVGIMNIMLVSVTERTKEIGIRKAVGATNNHILFQFLVESVILSIVGGIIATVTASIGAFAINRYSSLPISVTPFIILLALGFSIIVGIIFGVLPAMNAAKKDPIVSLRSE